MNLCGLNGRNSVLGENASSIGTQDTTVEVPTVDKRIHNSYRGYGSLGKSIRSERSAVRQPVWTTFFPSYVLMRCPVSFNQNSTWLVALASCLRSGRDGDFHQGKFKPVKENNRSERFGVFLFHNFLERLFGTL